MLARPLPMQESLQLAVLQPQSTPSQPLLHWHALHTHSPLPLAELQSLGHANWLSLQNAPLQPVPVGQSHVPHTHVPPLLAQAASHGVVEQSQFVPFQPPSHAQTPQSHVPWPAHGWPLLAAGGHGEKDTLQWGPL